MIKNTVDTYGSVSKFLHWSMALVMIGMIAAGFWMTSLADSQMKWDIIMIHKSVGFTALFLLLFRIYWRLTNTTPKLPDSLPKWQVLAANFNHFLLYLYMAVMLISGTFMSLFGKFGINWFGIIHIKLPYQNSELSGLLHKAHVTITDYAWILIALHVLVAFYHHFILKDNILRRMLP
jgi:cytochrome b561